MYVKLKILHNLHRRPYKKYNNGDRSRYRRSDDVPVDRVKHTGKKGGRALGLISQRIYLESHEASFVGLLQFYDSCARSARRISRWGISIQIDLNLR